MSVASYLGPRTMREVIDETLAGIVLFVSQVPLCVVFTKLVSDKLPPTVGMHSTWMVGLILALFGGTPPMINGCAGGLGSLMGGFVHDGEGLELLFVSISLAGVFMIIWGICGMDRFLALIPVTVMIGYCNGLAALIGFGQLGWFKDSCGKDLEGNALWGTCLHFSVGFLSAFIVPKISGRIPSAFVALVAGSVMEFMVLRPMGIETFTVESINVCIPLDSNTAVSTSFGASERGNMPKLFFMDSTYDMSKVDFYRDAHRIFVQAVLIAMVCAMDHLMTIEVLVDLTGIEGTNQKQLLAVGAANLISGLLGGIGGNSLIEMCLILLSAGGRHRLSCIIPPLGVAAVVFFASGILAWFPVGILAGITIKAVCDLFKWSSIFSVIASFLPLSEGTPEEVSNSGAFKRWLVGHRLPKYDAFIIVVTSIVIYKESNLAYGLSIGVFFASIRFAWEARGQLHVITIDSDDCRTYRISGNLFFASDRIQGYFEPANDPPEVKIDFRDAVIHDFSVVHAFNDVLAAYQQQGTKVTIANLNNGTVLHSLLNLHKHVEHQKRRMSSSVTGRTSVARSIRSLSAEPSSEPSQDIAVELAKSSPT